MPLLEIVRGEQTDDATLATAFATGKALKKTTILVKDSPSFIVNRLLGRFMGEVGRIVDEGTPLRSRTAPSPASPRCRRSCSCRWSGPRSRCTTTRRCTAPSRTASTSLRTSALVAAGKTSVYAAGRQHRPRGRGDVRGAREPDRPVPEQVRDRILSALAEEARLMLDEGVVTAPEDLDLAMITGAGFSFWNGGLTPLLDRPASRRRSPAARSTDHPSGPTVREAPLDEGGGRHWLVWAGAGTERPTYDRGRYRAATPPSPSSASTTRVLKALARRRLRVAVPDPGRDDPAAARGPRTSSASPRPAPARPRRSRCRSCRGSTSSRRRRRRWCSRRPASSRCRSARRSSGTPRTSRACTCCRSTAARAYGVQLSALRRGVHVVVGTPGRIMDHLEKGTLDLSRAALPRARRGRRDAQHGLRRGRRDDPRRHAGATSTSRCSPRRCRRRSGGSRRSTSHDAVRDHRQEQDVDGGQHHPALPEVVATRRRSTPSPASSRSRTSRG